MKKTHIALLILVVVAISVISATFLDFSTYETFTSASKNPQKSFYVIGFLDKGQGIKYDPNVNANSFSFFAKDKAGNMKKVVYVNGTPPQDIEKSEQLVMRGHMDGDNFVCSGIQMKCPSKYKKDMAIGDNG